MDFTGKVCPYCKTEFKEGDDIVVCSICEMPHHKECWIENAACTTFGCTGTIVGADQYAEGVDNKSFCSKCGAPLRQGQKFCASCGTPANATGEPHFQPAGAPQQQTYAQPQQNYTQPQQTYAPQPQTYAQPQNNPQQPIPPYGAGYNPYGQQQQQTMDHDMFTFIQANQQQYASRFQKMQLSNSNISWNWCSFLFGSAWFAYRKMYGIAAAYMVVNMIASMIPGLGGLINLALWVCGGLYGDYLYKQYMDKELQIAKSMDEVNKNSYIAQKGGTSTGAVFALIGASMLLSIIITSM